MDEREYPERPWLGVGGIVFRGDRVLLVKRGKEPGLGRWSIPGGVVDLGENAAAALEREILEETGLQVKAEKLVQVFERILPDARGRIRYHYVLLDYVCRFEGGEPRPASDASEAGFFPLSRLPDLNVPEETVQVIREAFKKFA
jgi:ADP-ribose pyrophosphatase YjhB (NUDIX family)